MASKRHGVEAQLSFALYGAANRMVRLHKPFLEPLGLTFPQYLALLALLDGGELAVGDLGAQLDMDTGTITPLLKRLHSAGFITRNRDTKDERRVLVAPTSQTRAIAEQLRDIPRKIKTACRLTERDLDELRRDLASLARPAE